MVKKLLCPNVRMYDELIKSKDTLIKCHTYCYTRSVYNVSAEKTVWRDGIVV